MKVRPLGDRILVNRIPEEARSEGGIVIPDTAKEKRKPPANPMGAEAAADG